MKDIIDDPVTDATAVIEDAIGTIDSNSADWQSALEGAIDTLTGKADDVVVSLDLIMQRTVSAAGTQTRCTLDFLGDRVKEQLKILLAKLKNETPPALRPAVCAAIPDNLQADKIPSPVTHLTFDGYNFDLARLKAFVVRTDGVRRDVTSKLNKPSHYSMTLPFGSAGATINATDQRVLVSWNDEQLVSVGITHPGIPDCEIREIGFTPSPITFIPTTHARGDKDFKGHGPKVDGYVMLLTTHLTTPNAVNRAVVRVYLEAKETKRDWTTVRGQKTYDVYGFPPGFRFWHRMSPQLLKSSFSYTDNDHQKDSIYPGEGPAKRVIVTGDTDGNDVGRTKVEVHFNDVRFKMKQIGNCR